MTGGEIVSGVAAAGKAAGKAGEKALSPTDGEKALLGEIAKDTPEMLHAGKEYAKRLAIRETLLRRIYSGMARVLGLREEYFEGKFAEELAAKTAGIPEENLQEPRPSVAFPAMQGLGFSVEEPDLKEMYLNLLATATDKESSDDAHPAFADVIRQLSAEEASVLQSILALEVWPVAQIRGFAEVGSSAYRVVVPQLLGLQVDGEEWIEPDKAGLWITNWARLGLVEVSFDKSLTADAHYFWLERHPATANLSVVTSAGTPPEDERPVEAVAKGVMEVTRFGVTFGRAVAPPAQTEKASSETGLDEN